METTKEDFELFKKECKKWINIYGLKTWEICFVHGSLTENRAECYADLNNRIASMYFGKEWEDVEKNDPTIKLNAFHETTELFLGEIRDMANQGIAYEKVDKEIHKIIRTLENVLFPKY